MSRIIQVKNTTPTDKTWIGVTIAPGEYYPLSEIEAAEWAENAAVFASVGNGDLVVNNGTVDLISTEGFNYLKGDTLPISNLDGKKLAVHSSPKPDIPGTPTYVIWTGAGDDINMSNPCDSIGAGELLSFNITYGTPVVTKDIKFDPRHGRVWIHEAYMKFENGGIPDFVTAYIVAPPTQLQTAVDTTLVVDSDGWIKYATGSPGGTHGFAETPKLIPRTYAKDGDWDYSEETGLVPNFSGTGKYKISSQEINVSRYINKIPCYGSTSTYFTMSSDETAELPVNLGFFIRIEAHNVSNTNWHIAVLMEIYRERTYCP